MDRSATNSIIYNSDSPLVMGIVNVTPDSFFSGSRCSIQGNLVQRVGDMLREGATIIDLGGCSTRPGGQPVFEKEELSRVLPALEVIRENFPDVILSIDTFRANVAKRAVAEYGVSIINDVYAYRYEGMLETAAELNVPYVLTHCDEIPSGQDFMESIKEFFYTRISELRSRGVENIIVDPGYGFGKTHSQNLALLARQSELKELGCPILAGLSRKRMVWQQLGITPDESLNGTTVLNTIAIQNGASIIRVHDVKEAVQVVRLLDVCVPDVERN